MKGKSLILFILVFVSAELSAQVDVKTESRSPNKGFLFSVHYVNHSPLFDMQNRFFNFNGIGMGVQFKTKSNFQFGLEYDWFFGQKVKDTTLFNGIIGETGQIIDEDGNFTVFRLNIKGSFAMANLGYLFNFNKQEPNSGLVFSLGIGSLIHKIDIQAPELKVPQINGEYAKGYDRLTYGLATRQYVGYQRLSDNKKFRFRVGLEFNQGYTQGRRTWNFTSNTSGKDQRFDGTFALRFSVILPVYTKDAEDEEFYIN